MELKDGGKKLSDYKDDINKRFDDRISELNEAIEKKVQNRSGTEFGSSKFTNINNEIRELNMQKMSLQKAKTYISSLIDANHGYSITVSEGKNLSDSNFNREGTVMWGSNDKELMIKYNSIETDVIDLIIHEAVHVYQVINDPSHAKYLISGYSTPNIDVSISRYAEVEAWQVSYSLGITNISSYFNVPAYVNENYPIVK